MSQIDSTLRRRVVVLSRQFDARSVFVGYACLHTPEPARTFTIATNF